MPAIVHRPCFGMNRGWYGLVCDRRTLRQKWLAAQLPEGLMVMSVLGYDITLPGGQISGISGRSMRYFCVRNNKTTALRTKATPSTHKLFPCTQGVEKFFNRNVNSSIACEPFLQEHVFFIHLNFRCLRHRYCHCSLFALLVKLLGECLFRITLFCHKIFQVMIEKVALLI